MTLPETYRSQVQHIQQSPKFQKRPEGGRQAVPLGYTVISASEEESQNFALYKNLNACQQQLCNFLWTRSNCACTPASFHLTLADLIWDIPLRK